MFSCCPWTTEGSGLKKDKNEGQVGTLKFMILSCLQCLWPFAQKETDLTQENQTQDYADEGEHECAPMVVTEPCTETHISTNMVENLVNRLVSSLQDGDLFFAPAFLNAYRQFTTTQYALDLLLKRFAYFYLDCEEDKHIKSTLCCFLDTWIDQYPEEFSQTILKKLKIYLTVNMPSSDLNVRVHMLLKELRQESNESEGKGEDSVSLPVTFLYKTESAADLSSSVEVRSYTSGDLEMEAWFPSGNVQPELAYLQETETLESTIKVISWD
ncbi:ral guanine nucleotide dissociation stimulator-like [Rattus norvegicus]|uniref:ral guanine nucleotide dissociation stimulator-like n=1 Tax=Rattus norvegicus TaxID=10116 RepID=UPI0019172D9E|nr:ral guanine nucleotide dissociation stimulator-like [Rattus norvegicus]